MVKMDEKGRIQLPAELRDAWHLKPKQRLFIKLEDQQVSLKKPGRLEAEEDPLLRDILVNPGHSKVRVTSRLLSKLKDEAWMP